MDYLNEWVESYARVNLRPSTYDGYKKTIANYINPYIGGVALNQLTPAMVDKMFQQIIDKGLKPSTAAGAKRVLSVALSHARKYHYIETNAAKDTLTKFGKKRQDTRPLHAGTGESPHAARGGDSLGNARYLGRALRYAPL